MTLLPRLSSKEQRKVYHDLLHKAGKKHELFTSAAIFKKLRNEKYQITQEELNLIRKKRHMHWYFMLLRIYQGLLIAVPNSGVYSQPFKTLHFWVMQNGEVMINCKVMGKATHSYIASISPEKKYYLLGTVNIGASFPEKQQPSIRKLQRSIGAMGQRMRYQTYVDSLLNGGKPHASK